MYHSSYYLLFHASDGSGVCYLCDFGAARRRRRKKRGTPGSGGRKNGTPSSQTKSPYSSDRKQPGSAGGSTGKRPAGSRSRREDARDDAEVGAAAGDGGAASGASTPRASIDQSSISQRESVEALERKLDLASAPKAAAATRAGASGTTSGTVSAAIQGTARQLDRAIKRDAVGHLLASRADPEQLKKQGILPGESAPSSRAARLFTPRRGASLMVSGPLGVLQRRPARLHLLSRRAGGR